MTHDVLLDCETDPPKDDHYGTVIAPNGSRAFMPGPLHAPVLRGLYGWEEAQ